MHWKTRMYLKTTAKVLIFLAYFLVMLIPVYLLGIVTKPL